jgi:hypothetical protein
MPHGSWRRKPGQPPINNMADYDDNTPLTTGQWFVTMLILAIPLVGLVMLFVWAFGGGNLNRRNYCRAALIWVAIAVGIGLIFGLMGGIFAAMAAGSAGY